MKKIANRVKVTTATVGQGTMTVGAVTSPAFYLPGEVGIVDGDVVPYVVVDGSNVEQGFGTIGGSVTTLTRDTVRKSRIAGVAGTTKLTLSGASTLFIGPAAEDLMFAETHGSDIASASTLDLQSSTGGYVRVTGTTTITAVTLNDGQERWVKFSGICQITVGGSLIGNGNGANITTAAGDIAVFRGETGAVYFVLFRANGKPVIDPLGVANTWTAVQGYAETALTYNATQTWDVSTAPNATLAPTGNITSFAVSNAVAGRYYHLRMVQDTSPRTVVYTGANFKFIGGAAPTLSVGSGAVDHYTFYARSSTLLEEVGRAQAVA